MNEIHFERLRSCIVTNVKGKKEQDVFWYIYL